MRVLFAANNKYPGTWLIRLFTFSKYSHVGIRISDELVVHSTAGKGVHFSSLLGFKKAYPTWIEVDITVPNELAAISFIISQIGKPYDWTAILGMIFQRKWQEDDSWFCSELLEAALIAGGKQRFRDEVYRITPQQSWAVI